MNKLYKLSIVFFCVILNASMLVKADQFDHLKPYRLDVVGEEIASRLRMADSCIRLYKGEEFANTLAEAMSRSTSDSREEILWEAFLLLAEHREFNVGNYGANLILETLVNEDSSGKIAASELSRRNLRIFLNNEFEQIAESYEREDYYEDENLIAKFSFSQDVGLEALQYLIKCEDGQDVELLRRFTTIDNSIFKVVSEARIEKFEKLRARELKQENVKLDHNLELKPPKKIEREKESFSANSHLKNNDFIWGVFVILILFALIAYWRIKKN